MSPYYDAGGIQIWCGDAREIMPLLRADLLVTDPPYGINFAAQPTKWQRRAGATPEGWDEAAPDWIAERVGHFTAACIWGGNYLPLPPSRGWLVWVKPDAPPSMASAELAWTSLDANIGVLTQSISATNRERVGHPTQKPLRVMNWCLARLPPGSVLDPFAGSGTTLVAAKAGGRRAIGIEINERYCEIAAKRLAQEVLFA